MVVLFYVFPRKLYRVILAIKTNWLLSGSSLFSYFCWCERSASDQSSLFLKPVILYFKVTVVAIGPRLPFGQPPLQTTVNTLLQVDQKYDPGIYQTANGYEQLGNRDLLVKNIVIYLFNVMNRAYWICVYYNIARYWQNAEFSLKRWIR